MTFDGVSKEELEEMFRKRLLEGFLAILIGTAFLNHNPGIGTPTKKLKWIETI